MPMRSLRLGLLRDITVATAFAVLCYVLAVAWGPSASDESLGRDALRGQAAAVERALRPVDGGGIAIDREALRGWSYEAYPDNLKFRLLDAHGRVLMASDAGRTGMGESGVPERPAARFSLWTDNGEPLHVLTQPARVNGADVWVQVARSHRWDELMRQATVPVRMESAIGVGLLALLFVSVAVALYLRRAFLPLQRAVDEARRINPRDRIGRLTLSRVPPEFALLLRAFNDALSRVERAHLGEQRLLANAVHELKTPLTVLRATVELHVPPAQQAHALREIDCMTRGITQLSQLAELSHADAYRFQHVQLSDLVRQAVAALASFADLRCVQIGTEFKPSEESIDADPSAVVIAVRNVVENAIKFSAPGQGVRIHVESRCVRVMDNGPGLPAVATSQLFERFWKGSSVQDGMGLGLSLVKEIMDAHGGSVDVERNATETVFALHFPRQRASVEPSAARRGRRS